LEGGGGRGFVLPIEEGTDMLIKYLKESLTAIKKLLEKEFNIPELQNCFKLINSRYWFSVR
jgi:hypothetical protein